MKALSRSSNKKQGAKVVGYLRVSTTDQDVEKNKKDIRSWCSSERLGKIEWVTEKISAWGNKDWRKRKLGPAVASLNSGDWLVTSEFSRLARSTKQVLDILAECKRKDVNVYVV